MFALITRALIREEHHRPSVPLERFGGTARFKASACDLLSVRVIAQRCSGITRFANTIRL